MKTRIKVIERRNGSKAYRPEYKQRWGWWQTMWVVETNIKDPDFEGFKTSCGTLCDEFQYQDNVEIAKLIIDSFLEKREEEILKRLENKGLEAVKTTHVKYP